MAIRGVSRLNNRKMHALRKDVMYEAIMTDLYLIGALEKSVVEQLTGHPLSSALTSPLTGKQPVEADATVEFEVCPTCGLPIDASLLDGITEDTVVCKTCGLPIEREV